MKFKKTCQNDYLYLSEKYPKVCFHLYQRNKRDKRLYDGTNYLFATEGYITIPPNYDIEFIKNFKGIITHNSKFYRKNKNKINIILSNGYPDWNSEFYKLENNEFTSYEKKIKGVCALYRIYKTGIEGDIVYLREQIFNKLENIIKHSYGRKSFGGEHFQKKSTDPSTNESLLIINKYLFCLALEPMYHEMWSWDWITERLWNCFRAKTMPLYFGCYNIEKLVPKEFYIDMRKYMITEKPKITFDCKKLVADLKAFPKEKYIETVNKAYEWQKKNRIGHIGDLDKLLGSLDYEDIK